MKIGIIEVGRCQDKIRGEAKGTGIWSKIKIKIHKQSLTKAAV